MMDEFKEYKRHFIQLNRNTMILLHIFSKEAHHEWEDIVLEDIDSYEEAMYKVHKEAAEHFIKQLEGNECIAFIRALRDECDNYLQRDAERSEKIRVRRENSSNK